MLCLCSFIWNALQGKQDETLFNGIKYEVEIMAKELGFVINPQVSGWQSSWTMHLYRYAALIFGSLIARAVQISVLKNDLFSLLFYSNTGGFLSATFCAHLFSTVLLPDLLICAISKPICSYLVTRVSTALCWLSINWQNFHIISLHITDFGPQVWYEV